jgi:ActR/RegA family two-component response regulator
MSAPTDWDESIDADWPTLDELSLRYLHRVIAHCNGNRTKAAKVLGIDRRTVSRTLSKASENDDAQTTQARDV